MAEGLAGGKRPVTKRGPRACKKGLKTPSYYTVWNTVYTLLECSPSSSRRIACKKKWNTAAGTGTRVPVIKTHALS